MWNSHLSWRKHWSWNGFGKGKRRESQHVIAEGCRCPRRRFQGCKFAWAIVGSWSLFREDLRCCARKRTTRHKRKRRGRDGIRTGRIGCSYDASLFTLRTRASTYPCVVPRVSTRYGWDGYIVWVHRCTLRRDPAGPDTADAWCITATGLCSGEYANQHARPGQILPPPLLFTIPFPLGSFWTHQNGQYTEGSRKSYIYIHTYIHVYIRALYEYYSRASVHFRATPRLVNPFNVQVREKSVCSRVARDICSEGRRVKKAGGNATLFQLKWSQFCYQRVRLLNPLLPFQ